MLVTTHFDFNQKLLQNLPAISVYFKLVAFWSLKELNLQDVTHRQVRVKFILCESAEQRTSIPHDRLGESVPPLVDIVMG